MTETKAAEKDKAVPDARANTSDPTSTCSGYPHSFPNVAEMNPAVLTSRRASARTRPWERRRDACVGEHVHVPTEEVFQILSEPDENEQRIVRTSFPWEG